MTTLGKKISIAILISIISGSTWAKHHYKHIVTPTPTYGSGDLTNRLNQIIRSNGGSATVGVQVKSMKQGDTLYTFNEHIPLVPASTLKVFTAEAALAYLGPEYKFQTKLLTNAPTVSNGMINGDVYLVHSGDPTLTFNDMNDLMVALKAQGIQGINGNVYVDTTAYDQNNIAPGWKWDDTRFCFSAPINASIINHNCLTFKIAPGKNPGQLANIIPNPRFYYPPIDNNVVTKASRSRACYVRLNANPNNVISLGGCMAKNSSARGASVVINDPLQYNKGMLQSLFRRYNIRINGVVSAKAAPPNLFELAKHQSQPLHILITEMLKKSDNIIAGSLFKKIGQVYTKTPGSWHNGGVAVTQILTEKTGLNPSQLNIIDGSGLSHNNRITARQMMQVLDYAYHSPTNYEFISALPIAGVDGTLKHRLYNAARKVRAKTGYVAGVVALAGYAIDKNKEPIAFVILVNGNKGNIWKYREMEDKIVTAITNYSRNA